MTMKNNGVEPSNLEVFIESHKDKKTKQLDPSAQGLVASVEVRMTEIPHGTPEDTAREQAVKEVIGPPSHGCVPLQGLLPPSSIVLKQKASMVETAMAAIERANREADIVRREVAESQAQLKVLKEHLDDMQRSQQKKDARAEAGLNAFIEKYGLMDTDALAAIYDSDATEGEYDVDTVQPTT